MPFYANLGAIQCSQCKGNGINSEDHFDGRFKAGGLCWLCRFFILNSHIYWSYSKFKWIFSMTYNFYWWNKKIINLTFFDSWMSFQEKIAKNWTFSIIWPTNSRFCLNQHGNHVNRYINCILVSKHTSKKHLMLSKQVLFA